MILKLIKMNLLFFAFLALSCSHKEKTPDMAPAASVPVVSTPAPELNKTQAAHVTTTVAASKEISAHPSTTTVQAEKSKEPAHDEHKKVEGVEPLQAFRWLQNGNSRYLKGFLRKDGQSKEDIQRLSTGQKPHTIVLSCSDSRVPPEIIFDQKLGEIFVVRTAGESLDPNALGSIEYAVEHLGARLILVMGHTSCGAVKAAIQTINGGDLGSPNLNHLVADIQPRLKDALTQGGTSKDLAKESWANARGVAADLLKRSAILQSAVEKGHVLIRTAMYHLDSGAVQFE